MSKNICILSIVIGIVIMLRCIFDNNVNLVYIVAGINITAIVFVIYTIVEKGVESIKRKVENTNVPIEIRSREIRAIRFKVFGICGTVSFVVIALYLLLWCSNLGNDVISILALGISILDDEITKIITDNYKI